MVCRFQWLAEAYLLCLCATDCHAAVPVVSGGVILWNPGCRSRRRHRQTIKKSLSEVESDDACARPTGRGRASTIKLQWTLNDWKSCFVQCASAKRYAGVELPSLSHSADHRIARISGASLWQKDDLGKKLGRFFVSFFKNFPQLCWRLILCSRAGWGDYIYSGREGFRQTMEMKHRTSAASEGALRAIAALATICELGQTAS